MEPMTFLGKWVVFGIFIVVISAAIYVSYQYGKEEGQIESAEEGFRREEDEKDGD